MIERRRRGVDGSNASHSQSIYQPSVSHSFKVNIHPIFSVTAVSPTLENTLFYRIRMAQ